jgi:DNA-binding SARP family transcriptional activator
MRFELLGPLRVLADGGEVPLRAGRERVLLAMLLLHADRAVPVDLLVEELWPGEQPRSARNQLQACVSRLRRRLAQAGLPDDLVITDAAGYRLRVDPDRVDAYEFRTLLADARAAGRPEQARDRYRAAAALWRGPALAGVDGPEVRRSAAALEEERVQSLQECLGVELALGMAGELVGELTELVQRYPYREGLHAALMRALYQAGRPADALAAFRRARQLLRDELGTDPGDELQQLHRSILNRDPALGAVQPTVAPSNPIGIVPRELPAEPPCFVDRDEETAAVREALLPVDRDALRRPPVVVLYGAGGVGKSALAVRVAHEVADGFSGGQLYVDLCGSTPGMRPLTTVEVLGRFLRRLGVAPDQIPSDEAEAAALFRSATADRYLLLLLDNAASKAQVQLLLPNSTHCAILVTSRHPLPTLDVARRQRVEVLPDAHGVSLLAELAGELDSDTDAARRIIAASGGLPLAIRVAAGRLACRPDLPTAEYADRLADSSRRLDELQLDDLAVRASISISYDEFRLSPDLLDRLAARAFRMLGLLHVPDISCGVVGAMLAESDSEMVRVALDRLVDAQLIEPVVGLRYRLHDLVRLVASEHAAEDGEPGENENAVERAVAFYTGGLWRAQRTLRPTNVPLFGYPPALYNVSLPTFSTSADARRWIDVELPSLSAALEQAVATPARRFAAWLGYALWSRLDAACEWREAHRMSRLMLDSVSERDYPELTACALLLHGRSEACLGHYELSRGYLEKALRSMRDMENHAGVVATLNGLGIVEEWGGEPEAALSRYVEALAIAERHDLADLVVAVLNNVSVSHSLLGQLDRAAAAAQRAIVICATRVENPAGRSTALGNAASLYCLLGDCVSAVRCANEALELAEIAGERRECEILIVRSEAYRQLGCLSEAFNDVEAALSLARTRDYRFAMAAAQEQLARILEAMGRNSEATQTRTQATDAYERTRVASQDAMIRLLLTHGRSGGVATFETLRQVPFGVGAHQASSRSATEATVDGALEQSGYTAG